MDYRKDYAENRLIGKGRGVAGQADQLAIRLDLQQCHRRYWMVRLLDK